MAVAVNRIWDDPGAFADCEGATAAVVAKVQDNVLNLGAWRDQLQANKTELKALQLLGASLMGKLTGGECSGRHGYMCA